MRSFKLKKYHEAHDLPQKMEEKESQKVSFDLLSEH
jgi:hypothetical protein